MINDLPEPQRGAKASVFADDSAIWKSGSNLKQVCSDVGENFTDIENWSSKWGFKISKAKTVAVIFTRKILRPDDLPKIYTNDGIPLEFKDEVKFLGLIFDKKLTWAPHINYLVDMTKPRLNLMRSLTGSEWGASKQTLLTLYRTLIRSKLDYACAAYDSASKTLKAKLDVIQSKALRICCGAMVGTPNSAVQVEMGEKPLSLRRIEIQAQYAVKIKLDENHPTAIILQDCWQNHYATYPDGQQPFSAKIGPITEGLHLIARGPKISPDPPWKWNPSPVDLSLAKIASKKQDSPEFLKSITLNLIESYNDKIAIFTDGSKSDNGQVGSAFYVKALKIKVNKRISDDCSVYAAELQAIIMALAWAIEARVLNIAIFSDSLSGLQSIQSGLSKSRPNLLLEIRQLLYKLNSVDGNITFAWIPSHVGVGGNETVDEEAKMAISKTAVELNTGLELTEIKAIIKKRINNLWQESWTNSKTGKHYKEIEPNVSKEIKYRNKLRHKETTITRLRLGKCWLNKYLKIIKRHPDGLCATCGIEESITHFLLNCRANKKLTDSLLDICKINNKEASLKELLSNRACLGKIYDHLRETKRKL